jgi:cold shock CspA family protein
MAAGAAGVGAAGEATQGGGAYTREPDGGGKDIFIHIKAFPSGSGRPSIGQALTFEIEPGPNGKSRAHSVKY